MATTGEARDVQVHPELAALETQTRELDALLAELAPAEWERVTRCPPLTVLELVTHLTQGLRRVEEALGRDAKSADSDRVAWWGYDNDVVAPAVLKGAQEGASGRSPAEALNEFREASEAVLSRFRETPPASVVRWKGTTEKTIGVADLAATRVLELGVHTMDIGHATLRGERLHPKAEEVILGILHDRLGEPLPLKAGWSRRTFILTATGRRRLEPNERVTLGPLADRFPLIR